MTNDNKPQPSASDDAHPELDSSQIKSGEGHSPDPEDKKENKDDAFIEGDTVTIAPKIAGYATSL